MQQIHTQFPNDFLTDCVILRPRGKGRSSREMGFSGRTIVSRSPASHLMVRFFPDKPLSSICVYCVVCVESGLSGKCDVLYSAGEGFGRWFE